MNLGKKTMFPKLTIKLKNFRTYTVNPHSEDGVFTFSFEQGVNLLKGSSGAGKSTVFMAISWCLFKKPSVGNTPLYGGANKDTVVALTIEDQYTITRTSPKMTFSVKIHTSNHTLENEEAQLFVYQLYGKEHVWKTCNYVSQGSINNLISGDLTDAQRWDVLYTLAFETGQQREDVSIDGLKTEIRKKIDEHNSEYRNLETQNSKLDEKLLSLQTQIKEIQERITEMHPIYSIKEEELQDLITVSKIVREPPIDQINIDNLEESIGVIRDTIRRLGGERKNLEEEKEKLTEERVLKTANLKNELKTITSSITSTQLSLQDEVRKLELSRRYLKVMGSIRETYPPLREEMRKWEEGNDVVNRLLKILPRLQWLQQTEWREITKSDAELSLQEEISEGERITTLHRLTTERERLEGRILKSLPQLNSTPGEWLPNLHYDSPEGLVRIVCPCCSKELSLKFSKNSLVESVKEYRGEMAIPREVVELVRERDRVYKEIENLPPPPKHITNPRSKTTLTNLLNNTQTWRGLPEGFKKILLSIVGMEPVSSLLISDIQKLETFKYEEGIELRIQNLESNLRESSELMEKVTLELALIDNEYSIKLQTLSNLSLESKSRILSLERELEGNERKLGELKRDFKWWLRMRELEIASLSEFGRVVSARKDYFDQCSQLKLLIEKEEKTMEKRNQFMTSVKNLASKIQLLVEIQQDLDETENYILMDSVNRVSNFTNLFLDNAFDNPILVNLITEKETKGGKGRKHTVGISIKAGKPGLPNLVERSLDGFSGGETDRISLGFSSAITTFSPFPVLMLDECISSLDTEMKDKVIRALRQQAKMTNKAVILICHDAVDGLFDHVAEVGV